MRTHCLPLFAGALLLACGNSKVSNPGGSGSGGGSDAGSGDAGATGTSDAGSTAVTRTLTLHVSGGGDVRGGSFDCRADCQQQLVDGQAVHLEVVPDTGMTFDGWQGDCSGAKSCDLTMSADHTANASFSPVPPPPPGMLVISVAFTGNGSGKVSSSPAGIDCPSACSLAVAAGTVVTLTAQPDAGSSFAGWGGACSGSVCSFTASSSATAWANFVASAPPPPADDCAGLVPPAPGPATASFTTTVLGFDRSTTSTVCRPGFADGDGTLALQITDGRSGAGHETNFLGPSGAQLNSALDGETTITEQLDGFIDANFDGQDSLIRYDSTGTSRAVTARFDTVRAIAGDPTGGAVALIMEPAGSVDTVTSVTLAAWDAHLAARWQVALPTEPVALATVDRAGNTLVIIDGDDRFGPHTVAAVWVDHAGTVGSEFLLHAAMPSGSPAHDVIFTVADRIGSGLFIGAEGSWLAQLDALSTSPAAPPAWLSARPVSSLHVVHGGEGYAVLPNPALGDCAQTIDIVSPSGKTCGSQSFRAANGTCATLAIRVGYDGTVVQQVPASQECTWQWWSGYFR